MASSFVAVDLSLSFVASASLSSGIFPVHSCDCLEDGLVLCGGRPEPELRGQRFPLLLLKPHLSLALPPAHPLPYLSPVLVRQQKEEPLGVVRHFDVHGSLS